MKHVWSILAALGVAVGIAGCATYGGNLKDSASRLERSSYALERSASLERDGYNDRDYRRDAVALAEEARDFRRALEDPRADSADIHDAFSDVSRSYHALRDEVERSHSREAERDFAPVTEAYLDIEREMDRGHWRDRYARD